MIVLPIYRALPRRKTLTPKKSSRFDLFNIFELRKDGSGNILGKLGTVGQLGPVHTCLADCGDCAGNCIVTLAGVSLNSAYQFTDCNGIGPTRTLACFSSSGGIAQWRYTEVDTFTNAGGGACRNVVWRADWDSKFFVWNIYVEQDSVGSGIYYFIAQNASAGCGGLTGVNNDQTATTDFGYGGTCDFSA